METHPGRRLLFIKGRLTPARNAGVLHDPADRLRRFDEVSIRRIDRVRAVRRTPRWSR
jgi:hypothetical protein